MSLPQLLDLKTLVKICMGDLSVFNQLVQALNTVPAVAEVLNKPIKDVAPMTASEGDTTTCLVELINPVYQVLRAATL